MTAETVLSPSADPQPQPGSAAGRGERHTGPSLSPSRAADFKTCPLLFRFRTIDRLPEKPTPDQVRGTLVHAVLESLFDMPAAERTPAAAAALVAPSWARLREQEPALEALFAEAVNAPTSAGAVSGGAVSGGAVSGGAVSGGAASDGAASDGAASGGAADGDAGPMAAPGETLPGLEAAGEAERIAAFLAGAGDLLAGYFAVEDPQRLEPAERESLVSTLVDDELLIRGYIDRLDISPTGDLRVVDYKTGGAPREAFEGRALFQLKFYALVLWRTRGVVPRVLRLLYLKDAEICDYSPDAAELERFERTLVALSQAIERAKQDKDFRPKPSKLCGWCSHQAFCPEFGGTPPPYPEPEPEPVAAPEAEDDTITLPVPRQS
ncbi:PD-(D/E)XK nuclease family protein [Actinoplanes sp. NPDC048967]|uniref:RecB family exonuclease n=1 Tax=Actinoplanes sp. NPDC048967 TaxID=3155269 RepID=UPI0034071639